jgi:hypothetical protein
MRSDLSQPEFKYGIAIFCLVSYRTTASCVRTYGWRMKLPPRHIWTIVAVALSAAAVSCANLRDQAGQDPDQQTAARAMITTWAAAIADSDGGRACALMTRTAQDQFATRQSVRDCREAVTDLSRSLGPTGRNELRGVQVGQIAFSAPDKAIADIGDIGHLELTRVSGAWLISNVNDAFRTGTGGAFPPPPTSFLPAPPSATPSG